MQIKLFINKERLEKKDIALGIYFDINLTWNTHTELLNTQTTNWIKGLVSYKKIRKFVQEKTLKNISNAFLKPYLDIGVEWSSKNIYT